MSLTASVDGFCLLCVPCQAGLLGVDQQPIISVYGAEYPALLPGGLTSGSALSCLQTVSVLFFLWFPVYRSDDCGHSL